MIRISSVILQQFITAGIESTIWQNDFFNQPFLSLALWHLLLLTIVFIIYYESKHGFKKTIGMIGHFFNWFKRAKRNNEIIYLTSRYKENSKKTYLINALVVVALVLLVAFILYIKLIFFTVVISDSMNPSIEKGDLVMMQRIYVKPEIGDIINFEVSAVQLSVTHRIISISGNEIRTRGDSNANEDPWKITKANILGKIVTLSGKPVIIKDLGEYFFIDASKSGRTYGPEFNAISTLIRGIKFTGFVIFSICMILYVVFSLREYRRAKL